MRFLAADSKRTVTVVTLILIAVASCGPRQPQASSEPQVLTTPEKVRMAESFRNAGRMNDALELLDELAAVVLERHHYEQADRERAGHDGDGAQGLAARRQGWRGGRVALVRALDVHVAYGASDVPRFSSAARAGHRAA